MADLSPQINPLRDQIDALDSGLLDHLVQRCAMAQSIAEAKKAQGDIGFGWRVAREVQILRRLLARAPQLKPALIIQVWRAIISANLAEQGPYDVLATPESLGYAEVFFGAATIAQSINNPAEIFTQLTKKERAIAVLPMPHNGFDWWALLDDAAFGDLYVRAACFDGTNPKIIRALAVASLPTEPSGQDISLVISDAGFARDNGENIIRIKDNRALIEVEGSPDFAAERWRTLEQKANMRLLGVFGTI